MKSSVRLFLLASIAAGSVFAFAAFAQDAPIDSSHPRDEAKHNGHLMKRDQHHMNKELNHNIKDVHHQRDKAAHLTQPASVQ